MEISKSTPYVRYRENISSTLHKGTIHIESEYLDRERKTTIESIEGQTWQNMVIGENKEEEILPRLGLKIEGNEDILDSVEQHMPIDTIIGDIEPVANEDGTYTYEISTMEGSYAKTLDGENNFLLTSDGLVGDMYIKYNAQGEEVNGNIVMDNQQSNYTIEDSNTGEIKDAILKGKTLVNLSNTNMINLENGRMQDIELNMNLEVGKSYTLITNISNNDETGVTLYGVTDSGQLALFAIKGNGASKLLIEASKITNNIKGLKIQISATDYTNGKRGLFENIMVIEGDYTNIYIPYFEGMQSVKMPVLTTSNYKNLANDIFIDYGYISDGIINIQKKWLISDFICIEPNVSYTTRSQGATNDGVFAIAFYDKDKNFISKITSTNEISPTNAKFVRINVRRKNGSDITEEEKNDTILYLEKTTEVLPFESHKTNILTVNEDIMLRGVGDVKDELDLLTGQVTERIGEVVLDGKNDVKILISSTSSNYPSITRFWVRDGELSNLLLRSGERIMCDKLPVRADGDYEKITASDGFDIHIKTSKLSEETVEAFKEYLSQNPITVQYPLNVASVKTVDLIIKDQDNRTIKSLSTHPSTTHINLSSYGLIPNAELSYTMYGNIGETTGEQITDGTDSKLIEGKIYGDTLLNVLPSPSLKNSMDDISMQKLNNGYDNINVVDGEFKSAILQGRGQSQSQALPTNIFNNWENKTGTYTPTHTQDGYFLFTGGNIDIKVNLNDIPTFKRNVEYTFIFRIKNSTYNGANGNILRMEFGSTMLYTDDVKTGIWKTKMSFSTSATNCYVRAYAWPGSTGSAEISLKIIEGDYTNIDVPESSTQPEPVVMPSVTTCGKNLFSGIHIQTTDLYGRYYVGNDTYTLSLSDKDTTIDLTGIGIGNNTPNTVNWLANNGEIYGNSRTFTNSHIVYYPNSEETLNKLKQRFNIQIEKGSVATSYEPYKSNILTVNEDVELRGIGDVKDELDLMARKLTQRIGEDGSVLSQEIVKTVDISIVDQDNQPQTVLHSFANGYINVTSQGSLPKVTYEVPTSNSYYLVDMVKPNTQYTTKSSSDCNAIIDGVTYPLSANGTFTTPSTITDKLMVLDAPVDDLMFIDGDLTGRELDYFTGMQSVENPIVDVCGKNLFNCTNVKNINNSYTVIGMNIDNCIITNTLVEKGKQYTLSLHANISGSTGNAFQLGYMNYSNVVDGVEKASHIIKYINGAINETSTITFIAQATDFIKICIATSKTSYYAKLSNIQLEKDSTATPYEPYQGSILTTNEPIALHRIGDVKDELDLVNECVVRRIGKSVFDGSDDETYNTETTNNSNYLVFITWTDNRKFNQNWIVDWMIGRGGNNDILNVEYEGLGFYGDSSTPNKVIIKILKSRLSSPDINGFKQWLSKNPVTVLYELATPTTEPVHIVPQNPKQSTASLTLQLPLQKVGNVSDQLRWNPYKGHYVRYNYIQDGVANSTYTFEDLKDMNERKYVNLYNQRTYVDTDHTVQVISHGLSRYCLAEQDKQYQVRWDWIGQPSVDTIKVDLCGNVKEIPSSDNSVVIDVEKFTHQFVQIQGLGLTGKITNLMVIETVNGEIPDIDFFSGIQCVGNTVNINGNTKVQIDMEQTNGNLFDNTIEIYNNGNNIRFMLDMVRPNKTYTFKHGNSVITKTMKYNQKQFNDSGQYAIQISNNGSANTHYKVELCYADVAKDGIRPRYYDKESIILPMKLCRVGNIYDNLYYDDLKGYYRIQQSIGHKYFTGETTEVWTMETTDGYRTIKLTCTSANIDQIALGQTICNSFRHLSTINEDMEGFIIYNGNFVLRIDKDRLVDKTVDGFKALLASSPIHLFYQLKTPQMINLTEYPNRIEFNTYRDEIFTFFKGMNPTKFTLSVPMDKTYRYEIAEEGQGLANRVTVNNETISAENVVAVKEVRGQGIANIIEDVNNVVITPRPNHGAVATSHTLNNTKPATIRVHGFEPSGNTAIGTYNVTDKAYQLKVMSSNGDSSLSDYYVLNVPYKLETYADGTKDMVYYDEEYKQWHFKGSSVKEYTVASNGTLNEIIEIFKGLAPRSGMIAEFKLMFTSGSTTSRMYYSLDGVTYNYTGLKGMSDGNYLYVGIFNTGGTKIDIAYKADPNAEYTNFVPLSIQVPECFMINQITNCTFCELTLDKQYIYSEMNSPIELDTYDGSTKVFMDGNATDTNIIIRNEGTTKIVNTYTDTTYTVYWKYVDGLGNLRITLGGTTIEVDGKQEYATIKTQLNAPQELLYVGGYNLSIKDLMVVKGAKINDLPYFEGSRQVGTLVLDEEGNKSYKITLVQGGSVLEQRDEDAIAFKDDNKHNVVVHKIVGVCPTKVD